MKTSNILIFGGAFNPPTLAHEAIIGQLLQLPQFAEVWIMASGDRLDKHIGVSDDHRLAMLELIKKERFANDSRLRISDFELNLPRPTATYHTLAALERAYPHAAFWFAFGADSYISMPSWPYGIQLQQKLQNIVLFTRAGQIAPANAKAIRIELAPALHNISSTELRRLARAGQSLRGMVSPQIAEYTVQHRLYTDRLT